MLSKKKCFFSSVNFALLARFFCIGATIRIGCLPYAGLFRFEIKRPLDKIYMFLKDQQILCKKKNALENAFLSMKSLPFLAQFFSKEKIQQQKITRHLSSKS